jgi:hypothetical protein
MFKPGFQRKPPKRQKQPRKTSWALEWLSLSLCTKRQPALVQRRRILIIISSYYNIVSCISFFFGGGGRECDTELTLCTPLLARTHTFSCANVRHKELTYLNFLLNFRYRLDTFADRSFSFTYICTSSLPMARPRSSSFGPVWMRQLKQNVSTKVILYSKQRAKLILA